MKSTASRCVPLPLRRDDCLLVLHTRRIHKSYLPGNSHYFKKSRMPSVARQLPTDDMRQSSNSR